MKRMQLFWWALGYLVLANASVFAFGTEDADCNLPEAEIAGASAYLSARLGADLYEGHVVFVNCGFRGQQTDSENFWALFRFTPPTSAGDSVDVLLLKLQPGGEWICQSGEVPNCAEFPELCEIQISYNDALRLAMEDGFEFSPIELSVTLQINRYVNGLAWRVGKLVVVGTSQKPMRTYVINAYTGEIVKGLKSRN